MPNPTDDTRGIENRDFLVPNMIPVAQSDNLIEWTPADEIITGDGTLSGLTDVELTDPAEDEVLTFDGTEWVNAPASGGATTLDELDDVIISDLVSGQILVSSGFGSFVNQNPSEILPNPTKFNTVSSIFESTTRFLVTDTGAGDVAISDQGVNLTVSSGAGSGVAAIQYGANSNVEFVNLFTAHIANVGLATSDEVAYIGIAAGTETTAAAIEAGNFVGLRITGGATLTIEAVSIADGVETAIVGGMTTLQGKFLAIQRVGTNSETTSYLVTLGGSGVGNLTTNLPAAQSLYGVFTALVSNTTGTSASELDVECFRAEYLAAL